MSTPSNTKQTHLRKKGKFGDIEQGRRTGSSSATLDAEVQETDSGATTPTPGRAQSDSLFMPGHDSHLEDAIGSLQTQHSIGDTGADADDSSAAQKRKASATSIMSTGSAMSRELADKRKEALAAATREMSEEPLGPVEQLSEARDILEEVESSYKKMSDFLAVPGHDDYTVEAVSFSKLKEGHYEALGVKLFEPIASYKTVSSAIDDQLKTIKVEPHLSSLWKDVNEGYNGFTNVYKRILRVVALGPEARARALTDNFVILALDTLADQGRLCMAFLELNIADSRKKSGAKIIEHQNEKAEKFATFLTGSVDYAVITCTETSGNNTRRSEKEKTIIRDAFENARNDLYQQTSLDDLLVSSGYRFIKDHAIHIAILEEKRENTILEDCQPQVIGEALAILTKLSLRKLPWCLTNGVEWIFGVVTTDGGGILQKRKSYRLPIMTIDTKNPTPEKLWKIFKTLTYWVSADASNIENLLK